jgi:hypothetical protein
MAQVNFTISASTTTGLAGRLYLVELSYLQRELYLSSTVFLGLCGSRGRQVPCGERGAGKCLIGAGEDVVSTNATGDSQGF